MTIKIRMIIFLKLCLAFFFMLSCKGASGGFAPGGPLRPLAIAPLSPTVIVNKSTALVASGGLSPYTFSVLSGGGTVVPATGLYTAPTTAGTAVVQVKDKLGAVANSTITIIAGLLITPVSATILAPATQQYTTTGGVAPFTYSIVSGPGSINASTGLYTPAAAGIVSILVSDSLGVTSTASLTVNGPLVVSPTSAYVVINSDLVLTPAGGTMPYTFSIVTGLGFIDPVTGIYTAPATTGTATLRTTDSATPTAATADTAVTIYNALTLSPLNVTMPVSTTQTFTAAGGVGTLTFSVASGTGSINSSTGVFTAPATAGSAVVQVKDTIGNVVAVQVTFVSQLTLVPSVLKLPVFSRMTFTSVLGTSPYVYSVFAGTGSINSTSGLYTAPAAASIGTARVTDAVPNTSDSALTHIEPVQISSGTYHSCVVYNEGSVKCWGLGSSGQLGNGSSANLGDTPSSLGGNLPFVSLGTGRAALSISVGYVHSCALLDNSTVKCWGSNSYGQLGIGNTVSMGSSVNQMGDNLPAVNLGAGRTATNLFVFGYETCAILDNFVTKCWGRNSNGQLGQDDVVNRGTSASQMGDNLFAINLGVGRSAVKLSGGLDFACALLDDATIKCWGGDRYGQLGQGTTAQFGDTVGSMATLPAISLGTSRTATDIGAGYSHACAVLDNGTAKCWGRNNKGQVGIDSTATSIGSGPGQMGDFLPIVPFTGFTPTKVFGGNTIQCASDASGAVRCWGLNSSGQLLVGTTVASIGRSAGDIEGLSNINMGTGVSSTSLGFGFYSVCTITANKRIKCWGSALNGALCGGQTATNLGTATTSTGDNLPWVNH